MILPRISVDDKSNPIYFSGNHKKVKQTAFYPSNLLYASNALCLKRIIYGNFFHGFVFVFPKKNP